MSALVLAPSGSLIYHLHKISFSHFSLRPVDEFNPSWVKRWKWVPRSNLYPMVPTPSPTRCSLVRRDVFFRSKGSFHYRVQRASGTALVPRYKEKAKAWTRKRFGTQKSIPCLLVGWTGWRARISILDVFGKRSKPKRGSKGGGMLRRDNAGEGRWWVYFFEEVSFAFDTLSVCMCLWVCRVLVLKESNAKVFG